MSRRAAVNENQETEEKKERQPAMKRRDPIRAEAEQEEATSESEG